MKVTALQASLAVGEEKVGVAGQFIVDEGPTPLITGGVLSAAITMVKLLPPLVLFGQLLLLLEEFSGVVKVPEEGNVEKVTLKFTVPPAKSVSELKVISVEESMLPVQPAGLETDTDETTNPEGNFILIHLVLF